MSSSKSWKIAISTQPYRFASLRSAPSPNSHMAAFGWRLHSGWIVGVTFLILFDLRSPLLSLKDEDAGSPFLNSTTAAGIDFKHQRGASDKKHLVETIGSGCAFLDFDSDGWLDILLINGGSTPDS